MALQQFNIVEIQKFKIMDFFMNEKPWGSFDVFAYTFVVQLQVQ